MERKPSKNRSISLVFTLVRMGNGGRKNPKRIPMLKFAWEPMQRVVVSDRGSWHTHTHTHVAMGNRKHATSYANGRSRCSLEGGRRQMHDIKNGGSRKKKRTAKKMV